MECWSIARGRTSKVAPPYGRRSSCAPVLPGAVLPEILGRLRGADRGHTMSARRQWREEAKDEIARV